MINKEQAKAGVYVLKGMMTEASPAEQAKVNNAMAKINEVLGEYGDEGKVAITIIVMELAAKGEFQ